MLGFLFIAYLITLGTCQDDSDYYYYEDYGPPLCPNGKLAEDYIIPYITRYINRNHRPEVIAGKQKNGPSGTKLPKGKVMMELEWSCELEEAAIAALNGTFPETAPATSADRTGLFKKYDIDWAEPDLYSAVNSWMSQIESHAVTYTPGDSAVRYHDKDAENLKEYLNLIRYDTSKIGCAYEIRKENNLHKLRAFCLTDKPPLKENDVVYEVGNGGCPTDQCPADSTCSLFGMCKKLSTNFT